MGSPSKAAKREWKRTRRTGQSLREWARDRAADQQFSSFPISDEAMRWAQRKGLAL